MKHRNYMLCLVLSLLLLAGMSGCKTQNPVSPQVQEPQEPGHLMSFYSRQGVSEGFASYVGNEMFVIQAPAGDYMIQYETTTGTYEIVFRATESSLIYVGLTGGDLVHTAVIYPGTIFNESGETWVNGTVTLYSWPGSEKYWWEVFSTSL
jgi:hypothetical protein